MDHRDIELSLYMSGHLYEVIELFRDQHDIPSIAEAMRVLIWRGLEEFSINPPSHPITDVEKMLAGRHKKV